MPCPYIATWQENKMSPRFKFKFASVLRQREIIEQNESKEFAKLHRLYSAEYEKHQQLKDKYSSTEKELDEKKSDGIDLNDIKIYNTYLDALKIDIGAGSCFPGFL